MKIRKEFILCETGEGHMLVPTGEAGFAGLVRGNKTLGAVLEALREDTTEEGIIAGMRARFDAPEAVIAADVNKVLAALRRIGALDE